MSARRAARKRPSQPTDGRGRHARLRLGLWTESHAPCPYACRTRVCALATEGSWPDLCATLSRLES